MKTDDAIKLLKEQGDPAERAIIEDWNELSQVLGSYVGIWAHHIYPRRNPDNTSFVSDAWMPFAGSHYKAIVRMYNALYKMRRIRVICNEFATGKPSKNLQLLANNEFQKKSNSPRISSIRAGLTELLGKRIQKLRKSFT